MARPEMTNHNGGFMRYAFVLLLLAGCAHNLTLMPRGAGPQGTGTLDRANNDMTVVLDGKTYRGKMQMVTGTSVGAFGQVTNQYTNQASALLIGDAGGQVRCDFGFDTLMTSGNGVCVDFRNVTYDLLVK